MNDTSPEVHARAMEKLFSLTPVQRVRRGFQMNSFIRTCARKGIRAQHPSWTESEVEGELFRRLYSDELSPKDFLYWHHRIVARFEAPEVQQPL